MKHEYFEWNGVRSTAYGIFVSEQPPIMIPNERITWEDIAGKSGSVAITEGEKVYEDLTMTVKCWTKKDADLSIVTAWIRGAGKITFANRPEGYYKGRLKSHAELKRLRNTDVREFSLAFRCEPYLYIKGVPDVEMTEAGSVTNRYNENALPIIRINGSGDFTFAVNDKTCTFTGIENGITLNSEIEEAYHESTSLNGSMEGAFPFLVPGGNDISWEGNIDSIIISPNWRKT